MRVLLLNPPGRRVYVRDYLCSKTTKSNYVYHPIDLLLLSGTAAETFDTAVLDCIAEGLSEAAAHARIARLDPDVVVSLVASVSWPEDRAFLERLARDGRRIVALGDVLHESSEERLAAEPWIEAALHDFTSRDLVDYLHGARDALADMTVRGADGVPRRVRQGAPSRTYRVPRPRHELFPRSGYRFSFARRTPFATVLTDYGCPYPCSFCVMSTLAFRVRRAADVLEEIDDLRARGVFELFFLDQTFGVDRERAFELCDAFAERGDLSWTAFVRPDRADAALLSAMRRGGCHTVILGVESGDPALLERYRKGYGTDEVRAGVARARAAGLRTVGTFLIGLPEETEASLAATLELALALELDFMSLNVAVPRFGTPFRRRAIELGLCDPDALVMDQAGASAALATRTLDRRQILRAKKRLVRRFYLRPSYWWTRARTAQGPRELLAQAREGLALFARNV